MLQFFMSGTGTAACSLCDDSFKSVNGLKKHYIRDHKQKLIASNLVTLTEEEYCVEMEKLREGQKHAGKHRSRETSTSRKKSKKDSGSSVPAGVGTSVSSVNVAEKSKSATEGAVRYSRSDVFLPAAMSV